MERNVWRKASDSTNNNGCVEVMHTDDGMVKVRDTKDAGAGPVLTFTPHEWRTFLNGASKGEFDLDA